MDFPFFSKKRTDETIYLGLFLKQEEGVCFLLESGREGIRILRKEKFIYSNGWENLTEDVDEVLFKIEKETKKTVKKTIFFIYSHLIDEKTGDIVKPYLSKIKSLSKNLELQPVGYIECHMATVSQIEKEEQLPLTAIILELDKDYVDLFIYKGGHEVYSKKIARSDNIIDDLELTFLAIKDKVLLPSRILIYNSVNLNDLSIQIVSYRWKQEIFIQTPRVEIVGEQKIYQSLVNLFSQQLTNNKQTPAAYAKPGQPEEKEVMGFVIGQEIENPPINIEKKIKKDNKLKESLIIFLQKIKLPKLSVHISIVAGIFLIVASIFLGEFVLHKADVTVYLPTQEVKKNLTLTGSDINIRFATKSAEIKVSKATSGKRAIGDSAHGEVTVHNFDDKNKTFSKGTMIDSGGMKFNFDDEVKVPASTLAADGSAKLPGKIKVKVTAAAIGSDSNLDKGKRFSIDDQPSSLFFAINESAFNGGTSKDIRTVSKSDYEDLKAQAIDKGKKSFGTIKERIIPSLTEYQLENLVFSKEIGEEALEVELKTKVVASYYEYTNEDLLQYLETELKKNAPPGYIVSTSNITYTIDKAQKVKNIINLEITAKSKSLKDVKTTDILDKISGRNEADLESILKKDFQTTGFKVDIGPKFFLFEHRLPFIKRNINITISSL